MMKAQGKTSKPPNFQTKRKWEISNGGGTRSVFVGLEGILSWSSGPAFARGYGEARSRPYLKASRASDI